MYMYMHVLHRYDTGRDKFIDFNELKVMMEKLGAPQTHLALKAMIKEVDEDCDSKISFREVLTPDIIYIYDLHLLYVGVPFIDALYLH